MTNLTSELKQALIDQALLYQERAYAPYSNYAVGASVLADDMQIYGGANIENSAYPSGLCAERVAIFHAISEGNKKILAVVVATKNGGSPCGSCRQVMREFGAPDMPIILVNEEGEVILESTLDAMLPYSFGPEDLV